MHGHQAVAASHVASIHIALIPPFSFQFPDIFGGLRDVLAASLLTEKLRAGGSPPAAGQGKKPVFREPTEVSQMSPFEQAGQNVRTVRRFLHG
jgi:hypothetical protein